MLEYNEDGQEIWDEEPSADNRELFRPFHARTPFKKVEPRPQAAELFAPYTPGGEALKKIRQMREQARNQEGQTA